MSRRHLAWLDAPYRWAFVVCVLTGLRAAFNRMRSRFLRSRALGTEIHAATIRSDPSGTMRVFVHRRPRPPRGQAATHFGMISRRTRAALEKKYRRLRRALDKASSDPGGSEFDAARVGVTPRR